MSCSFLQDCRGFHGREPVIAFLDSHACISSYVSSHGRRSLYIVSCTPIVCFPCVFFWQRLDEDGIVEASMGASMGANSDAFFLFSLCHAFSLQRRNRLLYFDFIRS